MVSFIYEGNSLSEYKVLSPGIIIIILRCQTHLARKSRRKRFGKGTGYARLHYPPTVFYCCFLRQRKRNEILLCQCLEMTLAAPSGHIFPSKLHYPLLFGFRT